MSLILEIRGFDEAIELLQEPDIEGQLETFLDTILRDLTLFAAANTPVKSGSMRDSWIWAIGGLTGRLFIDPSAVNRISGVRVIDYAPIVDQRVGILEKVERQWDVVAVEGLEEIGWDTP